MPLRRTEEFEVDFIQKIKNQLATNLTAKGQSSVGTETLTALVNKVPNIAIGKNWASGSGTVGSDDMARVNGLGFTPSIIWINSGDTANSTIQSYYRDTTRVANSIGLAFSQANVVSSWKLGITVSGGSFVANTYGHARNKPFEWIAIE